MRKISITFLMMLLSFSAYSQNSAYSWGSYQYGQLGNGLADYLPRQTASGTNWKEISCGVNHVLAIKNDGTLWAWGYNENYQLGNGSNINNFIPEQISIENDWSSISCFRWHSMAIKTDGTLWAWGTGIVGLHGDENITDKPNPKRIGTDNGLDIGFMRRTSYVSY